MRIELNRAGRALRSQRPWTPDYGYLLLLVPPVVFLSAFFLWPLLLVIARSLLEPTAGVGNFFAILTSSLYWRVFGNTFEIAGSATLVTLVLAYPTAWVISRARGSALPLALAIVIIPFWTSVVVRTFSWMVLFQRRGVLNELLIGTGLVHEPVRLLGTSVGMHIGMVHILLPLMILPLFNAMRSIEPDLINSAAVLGANPLRQFWYVYLPLSAQGIGAGCLLVFITALGFFITPALLGSPHDMMIAVLIAQQATQQLDWPMASALATLLLVATSLLFLFYERMVHSFDLRGPFGV